MYNKLVLLVATGLFCTACSASNASSNRTADPSTTQTQPDEPVSSTDEHPTSDTAQRTTLGPPCEQEILLECAEGQVDGCSQMGSDGASLTSVHVCIEASEGESPEDNAPCMQEIARVCPEGMTDACLLSPPPSTSHVCVAL